MADLHKLSAVWIRCAAALGIGFMHAAVWFLNKIGYKNTLTLGARAGELLYWLPVRMKARIRHNLRFALGAHLSREDQERMTREIIRSIAVNWFELFYYGGPNKHIVEDRVHWEGIEHLDRALARGKGVIAVSAHLGNYPILAQQFSRWGYPFVMVIRDPANKVISAMYAKGREMIELRSLSTEPERVFYRQALATLRNNGVLCLIADENKRRGGIFVEFFGHPASTAPGPAALALRTGAPIIPIFIVRNPDTTLRVVIERELQWQHRGDQEGDMLEITAAYTRIIEHYVRKHLTQWMWTNFRWRTQPWGPNDAAKIKKKRPIKKLIRRLRGISYQAVGKKQETFKNESSLPSLR
ncbi:MAG: lysophospholipid acyltransferase family protein [Desulfobacterota bacterium]|nr:lysophospholipid acyltransferase family protein [Thermodesulfobacteriota bacterium]